MHAPTSSHDHNHDHDHAHDYGGSHRCNPPLPHVPQAAHAVPLLEHPHPPLKFARQHNANIPHRHESGYARYSAARRVTLANAVGTLWNELASRAPIAYTHLENEKLIVYHYSQSKLSQQELADLQKATHFDKKELQQWYKGAHRHAQGTKSHD
jgi:hypothetical protein